MTLQTVTRLIAVVGRPNVGKSTLFNRLIKERKSLVHNQPGVTRDRIFGRAKHNGETFFLCDTGGFEPTSKDNIKTQLVQQAEIAIEEAEVVLFVVDGREGLHPIDSELIRRIRKKSKNFLVCVNKCDLPKDDYLAEDFRKLGIDKIFPVSAEHNRGIDTLLDAATGMFETQHDKTAVEDDSTISLAIIGRPNVGKSSILNRLAGESRSIVDDKPGTTRDSVDMATKYHGRSIKIIDTAGIRRKSRMVDRLENFSAMRSVDCLEKCDVAVLVIDALEGPTEGDARVAGYAFELRKPILVIINKWDLIEDKNNKSTIAYTEKVHEALRYIRYAPILFTSALENQRTSKIIPLALELYDQSNQRFSTSKVNNALRDTLLSHTPPLVKNKSRRIKFYYATQIGTLPPRFIIFCSHPSEIHFSYKRFLENSFREAFGFDRVPISLIFRERTRNPLQGDGTRLNPRAVTNRNIDDDIRAESFLPDEFSDEDGKYIDDLDFYEEEDSKR